MLLTKRWPQAGHRIPLWSLHVDEAEEGGGGISGLNVDELADSDLGSNCHGSLQ